MALSVLQRRFLLRAVALVAALVVPAASAQPAEEALQSFRQGNEHYQNKRYGEALAAYRKAQEAGLTGAALYFNRGNTLYRMDRLAEARLAYEHARRLQPDNTRIAHNIEQLKQRLTDHIAERPDPFWTRWWKQAKRSWSALSLFLIGIALYLAGLGLAGVELFRETARRGSRVLAGVLVAGAAVLMGAALLASWQNAHPRQAVVMAQETSLRAHPGSGSERTRKIHAGVLLDVIDADSSWTQIQLPNGETGWLPASSLEDL